MNKREIKKSFILLSLFILLCFVIPVFATILSEPIFVSADTSTDGCKVLLVFDREMGILPESPAGFTIMVDGSENLITEVALNENPAIIALSLTDTIYASATDIQVLYTAGTVASADGGILVSFDNQNVTNNSTILFPLFGFNYFYDSQKRLDYIELSTGEIIDFQYDLNGNLVKKELTN